MRPIRSRPKIILRMMIRLRECVLKPPATGAAAADDEEVGVLLVVDEVEDDVEDEVKEAEDDVLAAWVASADLAEFTPVTAPKAPDRN